MEALEAHLRAHLDDQDGWLVYADWLTDQGDARGELIRLKRRLAVEKLSKRERRALTAQIEAMVSEHQEKWLQGWSIPDKARLAWRHGFITGITLPWGEGALAAFEALVAHPVGCFVTRLELQRGDIDEQGARALARCQALRSLRVLDLSYNRLGDGGVTVLAKSEPFGTLHTLKLRFNDIGTLGAISLAGSEALRSLRVLDLSSNRIEDEGALSLIQSEALRGLHTLLLVYNPLGSETLAELRARHGGPGYRSPS